MVYLSRGLQYELNGAFLKFLAPLVADLNVSNHWPLGIVLFTRRDICCVYGFVSLTFDQGPAADDAS